MRVLAGMFLAVLLALAALSPAVRAGDEETGVNRGGEHRERKMPRMKEEAQQRRAQGLEWYMSLPDVQAEVEKHKQAIQALYAEAGQTRKAAIEKARADGATALTDEQRTEVQTALADVASRMIDEKIRFQRALADLLEKHKQEAIEKLKKEMAERANQAREEMNRRRGGHDTGDNAPAGGGENFEGAVF